MVTDHSAWSAVTYEDVAWFFRDESVVPRRALLAGRGFYRAAIPAEIADTAHLAVSGDTLTLVAEATSEIARFDTKLGADLVPFTPLLLRSESAASSKIENVSASAQSIFLAELGDPSRTNATIIVANTAAMTAALKLSDHLDSEAILAMHGALLGTSKPEWAGRWRDQQVWIGGGDYSPHHAAYIAPHHARVPLAINDLIRFVERNNLPPLAQAAIAHAQFETIHPFPDGNGRVGRALIHSVLKAKGLTRNITVPVSSGLLSSLDAYFRALTAYRAGDHEPIVVLAAEASFRAVNNATVLTHELRETAHLWRSTIKARKDASVWRLVDLLVRQPVLDSEIVQAQLGVSTHNANTAIELLEKLGILHKISGNHRYRKWAAKDVLDALDRFAERAGRRQDP